MTDSTFTINENGTTVLVYESSSDSDFLDNIWLYNWDDYESEEDKMKKYVLKINSMDPILNYVNNKPPLHWQGWRSRR